MGCGGCGKRRKRFKAAIAKQEEVNIPTQPKIGARAARIQARKIRIAKRNALMNAAKNLNQK